MRNVTFPNLIKLSPEFKTKWLEALRSGKYRQTAGVLNNNDGGFCCLGVAYDITGTGWRPFGEDRVCTPSNGTAMLNYVDIGTERKCLFQDIVVENCGSSDIAHYLATENDRGTPFSEIADWIEVHL
jgi:hypothetical protein